ncbi:hypothetical protein Y032_0212g2223 [Ancylostoma ceylanicum]|uniref:Uncharacterized protein n=1 Tax=Ancylostoma ceylanicum TaxID=53326 RepID=A0A016SKL7_9BILA|nr:hypothetical protein Y032_0212g2223 [Ancylostoma ceylanicum]
MAKVSSTLLQTSSFRCFQNFCQVIIWNLIGPTASRRAWRSAFVGSVLETVFEVQSMKQSLWLASRRVVSFWLETKGFLHDLRFDRLSPVAVPSDARDGKARCVGCIDME